MLPLAGKLKDDEKLCFPLLILSVVFVSLIEVLAQASKAPSSDKTWGHHLFIPNKYLGVSGFAQ